MVGGGAVVDSRQMLSTGFLLQYSVASCSVQPSEIQLKLGIGVHAWNPAHLKLRQDDYHTFQANLDYTV